MTHISALVFSACLLVDPAVTGLISYAVKLESLPGTYTVVGGAVVVAGVGCIMMGEHQRNSQHSSSQDKQMHSRKDKFREARKKKRHSVA